MNLWTANNYGIYQSTCRNIPEDLTFYLPAERNIYHSCIGVLSFNVIADWHISSDPSDVFLVTRFLYFSDFVWPYCVQETETKIFSFHAIFSLHKTETEPMGDLSCKPLCCSQRSVENCHIEHNPKLLSLTKNFCVLHIQSNTTIFHLVVQ